MIDLSGRVAIVTGAASGIGRGICQALSEQGAAVAALDLDGPGAEAAYRRNWRPGAGAPWP